MIETRIIRLKNCRKILSVEQLGQGDQPGRLAQKKGTVLVRDLSNVMLELKVAVSNATMFERNRRVWLIKQLAFNSLST